MKAWVWEWLAWRGGGYGVGQRDCLPLVMAWARARVWRVWALAERARVCVVWAWAGLRMMQFAMAVQAWALWVRAARARAQAQVCCVGEQGVGR